MKTPKVVQLTLLFLCLALVGSIAFVLHVWRSTLSQEEHLAIKGFHDVHVAALRTAWDKTQALLHHLYGSSSSLAKVFGNDSFSLPNGDQMSHALFLIFKAFYPIATQVTFTQKDGYLFSYLSQANATTSTIFSDASSLNGSFPSCCYYSQAVDLDTGIPLGPSFSTSLVPNATSWLDDAFSRTSTSISLGSKLNQADDPLILITSPMKNLSAVLSLGISVPGLLDMIDIAGDEGGSLFLVSEDGRVLQKNGNLPNCSFSLNNNMLSIRLESNFSKEFVISCNDGYEFVDVAVLDNGGQAFEFSCASLHLEKDAVLVQVFPSVSLVDHAHKLGILSYFLLLSILLSAAITSAFMFQWIIKYQRRDWFFRSSLIKQKEATQQAERKSMSKSLAFASASHDVRTSLAGITGLIELCRAEINPQSEMEKNLDQMSVCAAKLLGIVNSVLDMSKVEAGKMQLEEEEFDMSRLIEESVDIFHIVALKKGLEVIWDPCDGSVMSSSRVRGDSGRLKQIIDNLLSNAIKFTSEGHVVIRSWARRIKMEAPTDLTYNCNFTPASRHWSCFSGKNDDIFDDTNSAISPVYDSDTIEFVFEVEDTGVGIPKDKWESIFENFVQVREGHGGTGLGLGIVQSFVRLMNGEISIVDKSVNERGTCFKFNIFLKAGEADGGADFLSQEGHLSTDLPLSTTSEFKRRNHKAVQAGTHVILLIHGDATRRILGRWLDSHGVKTWEIDQWELLMPTLEKIIEQKSSISHLCVFERSHSFTEFAQGTESSLPAGETNASEINEVHHHRHRKTASFSAASPHILIVIDMGFEFYGKNPCLVADSLLNGVNYNQCRVIWLANSNTPAAEIAVVKNKEVTCDLLLHKPLHGSRLQAIMDLLQRFDQPKDVAEQYKTKRMLAKGGDPDLSIHIDDPKDTLSEQEKRGDPDLRITTEDKQDENMMMSPKRGDSDHQITIDKPLSGSKVLVAEDNQVLRRLTSATLTRLGAIVECCENGKEAVDVIRKAAQEGSMQRPPFDMIFMDCEMPIMNGYEATRQIREDEKQYGFHIPVIALTAHALGEHSVDFLQAGMDFHLMKPLQPAMLVALIDKINAI